MVWYGKNLFLGCHLQIVEKKFEEKKHRNMKPCINIGIWNLVLILVDASSIQYVASNDLNGISDRC